MDTTPMTPTERKLAAIATVAHTTLTNEAERLAALRSTLERAIMHADDESWPRNYLAAELTDIRQLLAIVADKRADALRMMETLLE